MMVRHQLALWCIDSTFRMYTNWSSAKKYMAQHIAAYLQTQGMVMGLAISIITYLKMTPGYYLCSSLIFYSYNFGIIWNTCLLQEYNFQIKNIFKIIIIASNIVFLSPRQFVDAILTNVGRMAPGLVNKTHGIVAPNHTIPLRLEWHFSLRWCIIIEKTLYCLLLYSGRFCLIIIGNELHQLFHHVLTSCSKSYHADPTQHSRNDLA